MLSQKKQRTRIEDLKIEDLSTDGNELFDLSEEVLTMVGVFGGSGCSTTSAGSCTEPGACDDTPD